MARRPRRSLIVLVGALLFALPLTAATTAGEWSVGDRLIPSDAGAHDFTGSDVAIEEDTAVVGFRHDDDAGAFAGSAVVFQRDAGGSWGEVTELHASDASSGDGLGDAVAVDRGTIAVGAPGKPVQTSGSGNNTTHATGAVYVFQRSVTGDFRQTAKVVPHGVQTWDRFGAAIALEGDTLLVGSPGDDLSSVDWAGSAYVFLRIADGAWVQQDRLVSPSPAYLDGFGSAVSLSSDRAAVAAPRGDGSGNNTGEVHVFERVLGTWTDSDLVAPNELDERDNFGKSIGLDGERLLVGADRDDQAARNAGAVYAFSDDRLTGWTREAKLVPPDLESSEDFGDAVSLNGRTALIGHPGDEDDTGTVHVYQRAGGAWTQIDELRPEDVTADDFESRLFGAAVDLDERIGIAGAPFHEGVGRNSGAAYVIDGPPCDTPPVLQATTGECLGTVSS